MSKITNDGLTRSGAGKLYAYGHSGRQRVNTERLDEWLYGWVRTMESVSLNDPLPTPTPPDRPNDDVTLPLCQRVRPAHHSQCMSEWSL